MARQPTRCLTVQVSVDDAEAFRTLARAQERSISAQLRTLIRAALASSGRRTGER
jgi:hypothetical protein